MQNTNSQFIWPLRIYYEDTDASGVVYHSQYLKFFERARTEWLRTLGFDQEHMRLELNIAFTMASAQVDYRRPARLDDAINVSAGLSEKRRASLVFTQTINRNETLLAQGRFRIACVSADKFRPCAIPDAIIQEMQ